MKTNFKVLSVFSGAGGLDFGFYKSGFEIVFANDIYADAVETYKLNIGTHIVCDDIKNIYNKILKFSGNVDVIIGGPPCQGFSVAGKMDPEDKRSQMIWEYVNIIELIRPKIFIMENVKALGTLSKWGAVRNKVLVKLRRLGYSTSFIVLNSSDYGVPQSRERVIFVGFYNNLSNIPDLEKILAPFKEKAKTVREVLSVLDVAGTGNNTEICKAKITLTDKPVLRKSPYAGMLFNGLGRPVRINGYCATLPASMGGNKTPIIDTDELYNNASSWVEEYHINITNGKTIPEYKLAPKRLRRLTVREAAIIQTFPLGFNFFGSQSSKYTQIGNAVPCELGYKIAQMVSYYLENSRYKGNYPTLPFQTELTEI